MSERPKPAVLLILDGFGVAPDSKGNAITQARMPVFRKLVQSYPAMTLRASGEEVGLPWGEMGNSEVGHLAIGAGRVYYQTFPRINQAIAQGTFFDETVFLQALEHVKKHKSRLHLVGLVSSGNVHSSQEHAWALLDLAKRHDISDVFIHAILDGRDTLYNAGIDFIGQLQEKCKEFGRGQIATVCGRYFAMDRDNRWDRTQKAYQAMVEGVGMFAEDPIEAIKASYAREVYDEEFVPTVIQKDGKPVAQIQKNDAAICFNFRPDRMRQLTKALSVPEFSKFKRTLVGNMLVATMTEYESGLPVNVVFGPQKIEQSLAQVLSEAGLKQLHIAETEKYAHVTFFLNGTKEEPFEGEERVIIPSPRVASYKEKPEMSLVELTDRLVKEIKAGVFDVIIANFANADMVAHTGDLPASIRAMEAIDAALGRVVEATLSKSGVVFVTADHGNGEELLNVRTGEIDKEHATNPVPFLLISKALEGQPSIAGDVPEGDLSLMPPVGMLADVAPTILAVLGLEQPAQMTGQPLI